MPQIAAPLCDGSLSITQRSPAVQQMSTSSCAHPAPCATQGVHLLKLQMSPLFGQQYSGVPSGPTVGPQAAPAAEHCGALAGGAQVPFWQVYPVPSPQKLPGQQAWFSPPQAHCGGVAEVTQVPPLQLLLAQQIEFTAPQLAQRPASHAVLEALQPVTAQQGWPKPPHWQVPLVQAPPALQPPPLQHFSPTAPQGWQTPTLLALWLTQTAPAPQKGAARQQGLFNAAARTVASDAAAVFAE